MPYTPKKCSYPGCEYVPGNRQNQIRHMEAVHEKKKTFPCPYIGCEFRSCRKDSVTNHYNTIHLKIKRQQCHVCPYRTNKRRDLRLHMNTHLKSGPHPDPAGRQVVATATPVRRKRKRIRYYESSSNEEEDDPSSGSSESPDDDDDVREGNSRASKNQPLVENQWMGIRTRSRSQSYAKWDKRCHVCDKDYDHNNSMLTHEDEGHHMDEDVPSDRQEKEATQEKQIIDHHNSEPEEAVSLTGSNRTISMQTGHLISAAQIADQDGSPDDATISSNRFFDDRRPAAMIPIALSPNPAAVVLTFASKQHVHSEERRFTCSHTGCSFSSKTKSSLTIHRNVHLKIRTKRCHICNTRFFFKSGLRAHMLSQHQTNHHDIDLCENCLTNFAWTKRNGVTPEDSLDEEQIRSKTKEKKRLCKATQLTDEDQSDSSETGSQSVDYGQQPDNQLVLSGHLDEDDEDINHEHEDVSSRSGLGEDAEDVNDSNSCAADAEMESEQAMVLQECDALCGSLMSAHESLDLQAAAEERDVVTIPVSDVSRGSDEEKDGTNSNQEEQVREEADEVDLNDDHELANNEPVVDEEENAVAQPGLSSRAQSNPSPHASVIVWASSSQTNVSKSGSHAVNQSKEEPEVIELSDDEEMSIDQVVDQSDETNCAPVETGVTPEGGHFISIRLYD